jgi:hypothetical protein
MGRKNNEYIEHLNEKMINENNPMWKNNNIRKTTLHNWVRRRLSKPQVCEICNQNIPFDLANKTGIYSRDLNNWKWLCRKCHMESDGRMKNLHRNPKLEMTEEEKQEYKKTYYKEWHLKHRKEQLEAMKLHWKNWYSIPENREKYLELRKEKRNLIKNQEVVNINGQMECTKVMHKL